MRHNVAARLSPLIARCTRRVASQCDILSQALPYFCHNLALLLPQFAPVACACRLCACSTRYSRRLCARCAACSVLDIGWRCLTSATIRARCAALMARGPGLGCRSALPYCCHNSRPLRGRHRWDTGVVVQVTGGVGISHHIEGSLSL